MALADGRSNTGSALATLFLLTARARSAIRRDNQKGSHRSPVRTGQLRSQRLAFWYATSFWQSSSPWMQISGR